jgi:hypothetical protein
VRDGIPVLLETEARTFPTKSSDFEHRSRSLIRPARLDPAARQALADIAGLPMVVRVARRACRAPPRGGSRRRSASSTPATHGVRR